MFFENIEDVNKREFMLLSTLVVPTVMLGIYPAPILDGLNYGASTLIFTSDFTVMCDATQA